MAVELKRILLLQVYICIYKYSVLRVQFDNQIRIALKCRSTKLLIPALISNF